MWGQADGIVRIKIRKDQAVRPLFQCEANDSVVLCATAPDHNRVWVALSSGLIRVFAFRFDPLRSHFQLTAPPSVLVGHQGAVHQIVLCTAFGVAVSGGCDGRCIVWDLHRTTFVRQFVAGQQEKNVVQHPVAQLAVSRTLADVACALQLAEGSRLELRTINGALVGAVHTAQSITSLCFSSAPEGQSINCVAAGLANGTVRLWNTWNLAHLRDISSDASWPIVGLAFSNDGSVLAIASSYMHEHEEPPEGTPEDTIYIRYVSDQETKPK